MRDKILGSILGAAVGDAMGAATETMSSGDIIRTYGGRVSEFEKPTEMNIAYGREAGQITDAFSIPYYLMASIIENNGRADCEIGKDALKKWGKSEYFERFAGMTTRKVVKRLEQSESDNLWDYIGNLGNTLFKGNYFALSSNGAACKAFPAGLLHPGDIDKAIDVAIELTMASHDDAYSISGACAVAAAVSRALCQGVTVHDVVDAAIYGSEQGESRAGSRDDVMSYPGPSVTKRIRKAVLLACMTGDAGERVNSIREYIGSGPAIAETVPAAIGILVANNGDVMGSIIDAVNIGDETSAVAEVVGAIAGAYCGASRISEDYLDIIQKANNIDIERQAEAILALQK